MKANIPSERLSQLSWPGTSRRLPFVNSRVFYLRDLLITLVSRDIKLRYKRSILGVAWSLLTPLAQLGVYYFTFNVLLPLNVPNYLAFLFSGVLVWNWFQGSLYQATSTIVENRELIKRPNFPAAILPAVTVASYLVHFLLALPVLFFVLFLSGIRMTSALIALPLIISLQFFMTLSIAYFTATFYVTFRDTQHLLGVLLNLLFFLTPIFYNSSDLPAKYQAFYRLNPMVHLVEAYRTILLTGGQPQPTSLLILTISTIAALFCGYRLFERASDHFVDEL